MIMDPMDATWTTEKYFTKAQNDIIRTYHAPVLPELPAKLSEYLSSYPDKVQLLQSCSVFIEIGVLNKGILM